MKIISREAQALAWDYYKPRHTHSWNMLVMSWREFEKPENDHGFDVEYKWENFILRLWLYRVTVKTLMKLEFAADSAKTAVKAFDLVFLLDGRNSLKAIRDMIEHFDDYAIGKGHGPASREQDLDSWRVVTKDRYERGHFLLDRTNSYQAAIKLRDDAHSISDQFTDWYRNTE